MCQKVTCPACSKPTFKGCGKHAEEVLRDVPKSDRCICKREPKKCDSSHNENRFMHWLKDIAGKRE